MQSYAYGALVDRWFAVYDRHYRPPIPMTEAEYQVKRYEAAWDTATFEPTAILDSHPTPTVSVAASYDLSELRRVAIEGAGWSKLVAAGEGEYRSMPLEGRVSLMRPEKPQAHAYDPTSDTHQMDQSQSQRETADEEPRPAGREGLPSHLYRPPARKSGLQPPSNWPPTPPCHDPHHDRDSRHQPHHQPHRQPHHRSFPPHPHSDSQLPQDNKPGSTDQEQSPDPVLLYVPTLYPELQNNAPATPGDVQQQGGSQHLYHHQEEYRPPSPPLITWNPAHEPPPHDPPPPMTWDLDNQHYSNVWDMPVPRQHRAPYHQYSPTYVEPAAHHQTRWSPPRQRSPQIYYTPTHGSPPSWHWDDHSRRSLPKGSEYGRQLLLLKQQEHKQQEPPRAFEGPPTSVQSPRMDWQQPKHFYHHYHHHEQQQFPHIEHQPQQYEQPPSHHHHIHRFYDEPRPDGFFHAPPPANIPTRLLKEGHYDKVLADNPRPDYKKVKPVFPWENPNRPRSSRVFPDWDPKPPALATPPRPPPVSLPPAGASSPERRSSLAPVVAAPYGSYSTFSSLSAPQRSPSPPPPPHVQRKFNPPPEPPRGYAGQYANAWDEDPVIQKYAHVITGGKSTSLGHPSPAPWPLHQGQIDFFNSPGSSKQRAKQRAIGRSRARDDEDWTNWAERAEASSRDGDDEDDEDEYIEEVQSPQTGLWRKEKRKRIKSKGSVYRSIGVQTDAIETKEVGVQVSMPLIVTPPMRLIPLQNMQVQEFRRGAGGMEYGREGGHIGWVGENLNPMQVDRHARAQRIGTGAMSPRLHDPMAYSPLQRSPTRSPTGTPFRLGSPSIGNVNVIKPNGSAVRSPTKVQPPDVRPRVSSGDTVTTAADSTIIASPATDLTVDFPEIVEQQEESPKRTPFPKTAIRVQQPSPTTTPPQASPDIAPPVRRRTGRIFDPARGVEIIKRTHEEVLTRFLKQGPASWGEKDQKKQDPSATP
jgi:glycogenin glucosyltransferase